MADQYVNPILFSPDCPEGAWTARLDEKTRDDASILNLNFTAVADGKKWWLRILSPERCAHQAGFDFQKDGNPGDIFVLIMERTEDGNLSLMSARSILKATASSGKPVVASTSAGLSVGAEAGTFQIFQFRETA